VRPHLNGKKLGVMVLAYKPSYGRKSKIEEVWSEITKAESAGGGRISS
jgi:hypothetical protein